MHVPLQSRSSFEPRVATVRAVQHIRKMRGGAQSHLIRCSDGQFYVVKFRNNPQHPRVLVNELMASKLAQCVGIPVPQSVIVEVPQRLVERTPELRITLAHNEVPCEGGAQFGSKYAVNPLKGQCFDHLPTETLDRVFGLISFGAVLALDKWTGNTDARQVLFCRNSRESFYTLVFIDQGYCFNGGEWSFPNVPLSGVYGRNEVYENIHGWHSFFTSIPLIENLDPATIWSIAKQIPPEWFNEDFMALTELVETLIDRRTTTRILIDAFRKSSRNPFPNWRDD